MKPLNLLNKSDSYFMCKVLFVLLLLLSPIVKAQQSDIQFEHLSMRDGLSMNPVMSIIQDKLGYLWFGTQDGLNKYDGYSFTVFKSLEGDTNSISDNFITSMCLDQQLNLWVGTLNGGLNKYDQATHRFKSYKFGNTFSRDTRIWTLRSEDNLIWLGTDKGVMVFDVIKNQFINAYQKYPMLSKLAKTSVLSITKDSKGEVWFGTTDGLYQMNLKMGTCNKYQHNPNDVSSLSNNVVLTIFESKDQEIWIGTLNGLNKFNRSKNVFEHFYFKKDNIDYKNTTGMVANGAGKYSIVNNYGGNTIRCILEDAKGELWVGTDMELIIFNPFNNSYVNYKKDLINPTGINDHFIRSMYYDNSGNLWIGTLGNGLNKTNLNPKKFEHYQKKLNNPQSLSENYVRAICEDKYGFVWIGTLVGGLDKFDVRTNTFSHFQKTAENSVKSINDNNVWALKYDKSNHALWIGTNNGLDYLDIEKGLFTHYTHNESDKSSISDNTIRSIHIGEDGVVWVGTENGLNRFNSKDKSFVSYTTQNSAISDNTVWKVIEDKQKVLWLATNNGLNRFDPLKESFVIYKKVQGDTNSLSHDGVRTLHIDKLGYLWVGTQNGLNRFDSKKQMFKRFNENNGLPNPFIYAILEDFSENLWISTNKGISRFNYSNNTFRNFGIYDGLQDFEFNTNAAFKSFSGIMFFGGPGGLNRFNPESLPIDTLHPPVVLTELKVLGQSMVNAIDSDSTLVLDYNQDIIYIEFSALDFSSSARNKYMYKMEGFNEDWINSGSIRFCTYTNLDPGEYTLYVKGSNADGIWSTKLLRIQFRIKPPFWRTWWFYFVIGVVVVLSISIVFRVRTRSLQKSKVLLESQVKARTFEVEQQKNELSQKNKDITDSINYAKRIQQSMLAEEGVLKNMFSDGFVIYLPRDIVSGDYYWMIPVTTSDERKLHLNLFAAIDCTGHGVPGAFMSLIVNDLLNQSVKNPDVNSPGELLMYLNRKLPEALNKNNAEKINDGVDIAVCAIDMKTAKVYFAGANRPLYLYKKAEKKLYVYSSTKAAIGGFTPLDQVYETQIYSLDKGDRLILFSDGYVDQFGGERNKKLGSKQFKKLIDETSVLPMEMQKQKIVSFFQNWKGDNDQVDDVLIIGIEF